MLLFGALLVVIVAVRAESRRAMPHFKAPAPLNASAFALPKLPTLYTIQKIRFSGPYGCISGYNGSALFVTQGSLQRNEPELLYYGNCPPSTPTWYGVAGGFVIDAGTKDITSFSLNDAIYFTMNGGYIFSPSVVQGHTYVKLVASSNVHAYMAITIDKIYPNGAADARWGVFQYQQMESTSESSGFSWSAHLK